MERTTLQIGDTAPDFTLTGVDGKEYALSDIANARATVVIFSCNHCPYVKAYEDRIIALDREFKERGVHLVAISANEDKNYPEDSFDNMVTRAREKGFAFPYLHDPTQATARAYGAERTPEVFLLDPERKLRYHGRIDDNWEHPEQVERHELREAIEAVLKGETPGITETPPVGCTIKWLPES